MNKNTIIFVLAFVLLINFAYARQYVVDNTNVINNPSAVESEIEEFNKETKGIIIIETIDGEDIDPEEMFHEKHKLGTEGSPDVNVLIVVDVKEGKGFVVYSSYHCKLKTAYDGIFNTPEVRALVKNKDYDQAFIAIIRKLREEAAKTYICPLSKPQQTFGCLYGTVQKPKIKENIIDTTLKRSGVKPTAIVLHFTGRSSLEESVQLLKDKGLIVQFMVDKDGTINQLMADIATMSAGAKCANRNSINIEIVGMNEEELLKNEKQFQSVSELVRWLSQQYDIDLLQQKASSPQQGLLAHSEVDLECPKATGKFDPGQLYMAKMRTNLCRRSMFFDLNGNTGKVPTKEELQKSKIALDKLKSIKNNAVHVILADKTVSKSKVEHTTESAIDPDCTLILQTAESNKVSIYSLPNMCTLRDNELKDVEKKISPIVEQSLKQKRVQDAIFTAASEVSKRIDQISEDDKKSITSTINDLATQAGTTVSNFFNPTGCAVCLTESGYVQQVMSVTSKLSKSAIDHAYERAKDKYANGNPFLHSEGDTWDFDNLNSNIRATRKTTMSDRIRSWPYYLLPQIFPEKRKSLVRFYTDNFQIFAPYDGVTYKDRTISVFGNSDCSYKVLSNNKVTKESKVTCNSEVTITVGPGKDCRDEGKDMCKIVMHNGESDDTLVWTISFKPSECFYTVMSNEKITKQSKVPCDAIIIVSVGKNKDCRDEGVDACEIITKSGNEEYKEKYSISFDKTQIQQDSYVFGGSFRTYSPGLWNCRVKVESAGKVTRDEKVPCSNDYDRDIIVSIGGFGGCMDEGTLICKITVSSGYIFKSYKTDIISVRRDVLYEIPEKEVLVDTKVMPKVERLVKALHRAVITASKNKYGIRVSPEEVYIITVGEGFNGVLFGFYVYGPDDIGINGFDSLGTDHIGSDISFLKTGGFVSQGLQIQPYSACCNEKHEPFVSGMYKNLEDALEGAAGTIAHRKYTLFRDLKEMGVNPSSLSRKQLNFWVYFYYNTGVANGKIALRKFVHDGVLDDSSFINAKNDELIYNRKNPRQNSIIRAVMIETVYGLGLLNLEGYSNYKG